jgi:hypothetical protein
MTPLNQATAAPIPVLLNGEEYRLSPLTGRDIAELDNWVKSDMIRAARESLPPDASELDRETTLQVAIRASMQVSFFKGFTGRTTDFARCTRLLWQLLRRCHPDLTLARVQDIAISDAQGVATAMETFAGLVGGKKNESEGATSSISPTT